MLSRGWALAQPSQRLARVESASPAVREAILLDFVGILPGMQSSLSAVSIV